MQCNANKTITAHHGYQIMHVAHMHLQIYLCKHRNKVLQQALGSTNLSICRMRIELSAAANF